MSLNNKIIGLFAIVLVVGLFSLVLPENASAGATGLGCCINNGGNCNPGCGSEGDSCFRDFDAQGNAPCPTDQEGSTCGGIDAENVGCFIEGDICFQVTANTGECRPAEGPDCDVDADCPENSDPVCFTPVCEEGTCGFVATGEPSCEVVSTTIVPTLNQWGIIIATIILGFFAVVMLRRAKESDLK